MEAGSEGLLVSTGFQPRNRINTESKNFLNGNSGHHLFEVKMQREKEYLSPDKSISSNPIGWIIHQKMRKLFQKAFPNKRNSSLASRCRLAINQTFYSLVGRKYPSI